MCLGVVLRHRVGISTPLCFHTTDPPFVGRSLSLKAAHSLDTSSFLGFVVANLYRTGRSFWFTDGQAVGVFLLSPCWTINREFDFFGNEMRYPDSLAIVLTCMKCFLRTLEILVPHTLLDVNDRVRASHQTGAR